MFLEEICEPHTIIETADDYGRKMYFDYQKTEKGRSILSSPSPIVLYLGTWRMTDRYGNKKKFICGLNLAYLDEGDLAAVQHALPDILKSKNMKTRYKVGSTLLPDIFRNAYRTYNTNNIMARPVRGRLYALKPTDQDKEEAKNLATKDGQEWNELDNQTRNQYMDQAVRKRGSEDVERQERSRQEREKLDQEREEEEDGEELAGKPARPKPAAPPKPPARPKPPTPPKPASFEPIKLGPEFEPEPQPLPKQDLTPKSEPIQSPAKNIRTGMVNPHKLTIRKPKPDEPETTEEGPNDFGPA